ncbi:MAG: DUF4382 domain-containing protein [Proteobacteria bacterium]|nr:DUF4382 domain-containing protein [Pseudomonadota bacterium]
MSTTRLQKFRKMSAASLLAITLTSCGGDSSSNGMADWRGGSDTGLLTLKITDAPIDSALEVWIRIDGVTLKHVDGPPEDIPFSMDVDLLTLQGINTHSLLDAIKIPSGNYDWIRLNVTAAKDGIFDSYIKLDDGTDHELDIPSGSETGLKLVSGLVVPANGSASKVIDFDLRKSIVSTLGGYSLDPVLRMTDEDSGVITGTVGGVLLSSPAACSDADPATGNAVYVYEGFDVTPDDIDNRPSEPVSSAAITLNPLTGNYEYTVGFIPYGDYTVALTCQADLDEPRTNDAITFFGVHNVSVVDTVVIPR